MHFRYSLLLLAVPCLLFHQVGTSNRYFPSLHQALLLSAILHLALLLSVIFTLALHPLLGEPVQDGPALVAEGAARVVGVQFPGVGQRPTLHNTCVTKYDRKNAGKVSHAMMTCWKKEGLSMLLLGIMVPTLYLFMAKLHGGCSRKESRKDRRDWLRRRNQKLSLVEHQAQRSGFWSLIGLCCKEPMPFLIDQPSTTASLISCTNSVWDLHSLKFILSIDARNTYRKVTEYTGL